MVSTTAPLAVRVPGVVQRVNSDGSSGLDACLRCGRRAPVNEAFSVLIPFEPASADKAIDTAGHALQTKAAQVILAGHGLKGVPPRAILVEPPSNGGADVHHAFHRVNEACTVLVIPGATPTEEQLQALSAPVQRDEADVVVPSGDAFNGHGVLDALARGISGLPVSHPLAPVTAVRTTALQSLHGLSSGPSAVAESLVKLAAQCFRFAEVELRGPLGRFSWSRRELRRLVTTYVRYAFFANDTDNIHEGYNTLIQLDQAPRYNAWLGGKLRPHLGKRVLEVGAGIGTITRQIAQGRERVIALEADGFYVQRLQNLFRGSTVVRPIHAPVESTDWEALSREGLDTVILSNVLEHIEDDAGAVRRFRSVLPRGGRLVILVPALQALHGSIDEAVGHHRRYHPDSLRRVIEENGFEVERLEWLNLLGIPGWYLNSRLLRRRSVPGLQVKLYDRLAPLLARAESAFQLPIGMSLLAVARAG
jgi:SAM-dependent methyltransferase